MTRVVLVTGGTSGVGLQCCRTLVQKENVHVIVVGRDATRVQKAVDQIQAIAASGSHATGKVADMSSLASVRALANAIISEKIELFALVCNAGVESPPVATSAEGFEMTFATNHLGHFLLATSLYRGGVFVKGEKARLVVISSGLHSPERGSSFPFPDVSDWDRVAFGGGKWGGRVAYATSKLCNLFFAYEFQRRFGDATNLLVYAYTPGFIPDTGLFRNHSSIGWAIVKTLLKVVAYFKPAMKERMSTPERSGEFLARLASDPDLPWDSGSYFSIDHLFHSSEQSKDPELAKELWERSEHWVDK